MGLHRTKLKQCIILKNHPNSLELIKQMCYQAFWSHNSVFSASASERLYDRMTLTDFTKKNKQKKTTTTVSCSVCLMNRKADLCHHVKKMPMWEIALSISAKMPIYCWQIALTDNGYHYSSS